MKDLPLVAQKFILHWGEMGTRWGINRTVAQVHALLFLSEKPLPADEIARLTEADPRITRSKNRVELKTAEVPSLLALPPGCTFHPRCPLAEPGLCDVLVPELLPLPAREAREVACHVAIRERQPAAELLA